MITIDDHSCWQFSIGVDMADRQNVAIVCQAEMSFETFCCINYRKISDMKVQNQNLNDSRLVLQLSLPNSLKLSVKSKMKM